MPRPRAVTLALALLALVIAGNVVGPLLPSSEGEIGFGIVAAVIALVAASGLWMRRRWGRIMTIIVAALNLLLNAPAVAAADTTLIKVVAGISVVACVAVIVLLTRPEARRADVS